MTEAPLRTPRAVELALLAILVALAAAVTAMAWGRCVDAVIDAGRDLYIPEQLARGTKLYRDILYYYPPLAPYLLAVIVGACGSSLLVHHLIGLATAMLTAAAIYLLARMTAGVYAAFAATLLFFACSMTNTTTLGTNYFFPYSHAATFGMLFFLAFGACLTAYLYVRRSAVLLAAAIVFALAASWSKVELALFAALIFALVVVIHRLPFVWLGAYGVAGAASLALVSRAFADAPAGHHWLTDNVLPAVLLHGSSAAHFYRKVSGVDQWPHNLTQSAIGAVLLLLLMGLIAWWERRQPTAPSLVRVLMLVAILLCSLAVAQPWLFRAFTILQVALIPVALRRPREPLALLLAFSLAATSRIFFKVSPLWYGFVFVIPVYVLMAYLAFCWLPERSVHSRRTALFWLLPVVFISINSLFFQFQKYAERTHPIVTRRGIFYDANADRAAAVNGFLGYLQETHPDGLVVMPEGLALNYFSGVPTPLSFQTFTPVEIADEEIESRIIRELVARNPRFIAMVTRDVREFGYDGLGIDYDLRLAAVIRARYAPSRSWPGRSFSVLLLERRNAGVVRPPPTGVPRPSA
jgi:hypothetical protein